MLNDLLTAALDALDTEAAAVPGNATMVALKNAAPKTGPAATPAVRRMAVRAGFVGASLHVLAFEMNLTRRECYQIVTTSPDVAMGFAIGFALRHGHLSVRDGLRALAGRFCKWEERRVFSLERELNPMASLERSEAADAG